MAQSYTSDDLKAVFAYPFQDEAWKNKFLIGSLIIFSGFIIPLIPFIFLYGYMAQIMHRIIVQKGSPYLPEWDDWGKLFIDGAKLLGAVFVYILPLLVVMFAGMFIFFFSVGFSGTLIAAAEQSGQEAGGLAAVLPILGTLSMLLLCGLTMLYAIGIGLLMPAIIGHVIATDDIMAAFRVGEWWAIFKANIGGFLIAYVIIMAISTALSFGLQLLYITIILCCLIPFLMPPITMYLFAIQGVIYAEAYRDGLAKLNNVSS